MKKERFVRTYNQSSMMETVEILVDRETGVNYLFRGKGYGGGMTPLLDGEGRVVVTKNTDLYED